MRGIVALVGLLLLLAGAGQSAEPADKPPLEEMKAIDLVRQLGDSSYEVRERISKELARRGKNAELALREGLKDGDAEVRRRSRYLLALAVRTELEIALDAILADSEDKSIEKLKSWPRFGKAFGTDKDARMLFVEMHSAEMPLFQALEKDPNEAARKLSERSQELQQLIFQPQFQGVPVIGRSSMAALLFVAADERVKVDANAVNMMINLLYQQEPQQWLRDSEGARKLLLALAERDDPSMQQQMLYLFGNLRMKESLDWAVKLVRNKETQTYGRALAMSLVGCLGDEEHIAVMEALMDDNTQVTQINFGGRGRQGLHTVQMRDVALAMTIQLNGLEPTDFGFDFNQFGGMRGLQPDGGRPFYWPYQCGFTDDANREAAFKKWKEHLAKEKGKDEKEKKD
jgi:hypothetical protein